MKRSRIFTLTLVLNAALIGAIAMIVNAQDSVGQVYLPLILGNEAQATATATETLPPDATSTPTTTSAPHETPTAVATPSPGATLTPTETSPPDATPMPTETSPPDTTPTPTVTDIPATECEQYGEANQRSSHFGVQMYWDTRPESQFFDSLAESAAGWVRTEVTWYRAEPENRVPADYNWTGPDHELALAKHTNIKVIGTFVHAPSWAAAAADGPFRSGMQAEFVEFVTAVVERYDGDGKDDAECSPIVNHWEFYNEPDSRHGWGLVPDEYADMLAAVYPSIKAANPNAQVVLGGVAQDWFVDQDGAFVRNWVQDVLEAGGGAHFDYMNIHAYPAYWPEHAAHFPGTHGKTEEYRQILVDYGFDKPMIISETGSYATEPDGWLAHRQAITLIEVLTEARAANIESVTWFTLHDLRNWDRYTGLVTNEIPPRQKPAFQALENITALLETANYVRAWTPETDGGEGYIGYEFDDQRNDRRLLAVWTYWEAPENVSTQLSFGVSSASTYDIYGLKTVLVDGDDGTVDGLITISFDKDPIFIELPR